MRRYRALIFKCKCGEKIRGTIVATAGGNAPKCFKCKRKYDIEKVIVEVIENG